MITTDKERAAQSREDKLTVNIKPIENGFTVRLESKTYAFHDLNETLEFVKEKLSKKTWKDGIIVKD